MPINRREFVSFGTAAGIVSATRASAQPADEPYHATEISNTGPRERFPMLVYSGFTALDIVGSQYALGSMVGAVVHLVANPREPVRSDTGLIFTPVVTFGDAVRDPDILFAPGGLRGTLNGMQTPETIAFMPGARQSGQARCEHLHRQLDSRRFRFVEGIPGDVALAEPRTDPSAAREMIDRIMFRFRKDAAAAIATAAPQMAGLVKPCDVARSS